MANISQLMGTLGRGSDTTVGHLTPGEVVIPRDVLDSEPQLMSAIIKAFNGFGEKSGKRIDWRQYMVGNPEASTNPNTGAEEFLVGGASGEGSAASDAAGAAAAAAATAAAAAGDVGSGPSEDAQTYSGIGSNTVGGAALGPGASPQSLGLDPEISFADPAYSQALQAFGIDPGFAAPDDPTNPGISAPTAAQDEAQNSMSPGQGATSNVGTMDTPVGVVTTYDLFDFLNPLPSMPMRESAKAIGGLIASITGFDPGIAPAMSGPTAETAQAQTENIIAMMSPARQETIRQLQQLNAPAAPAAMDPPAALGLSGAMTPLQQRAAIATQATQGDNSVYRSDEAKNYYRNLLRRSLIKPDGGLSPYGDILPVENQFLRQVLGLSYQPTSQSVLDAIAAA